MRLHTLDDIRRTVTPAAFEKATRYQRQGRARVTGMAEDGSRIEGQVQGTQRRPYTVSIDIETATDGRARIDGTCSCPVGDNCKHVAALLLESMAAPVGRKLATRLAIPASNPALSPQTEGWLAELDRALALSDDDYPAAIRQRLIYVLSIADAATDPPLPVLELRSVRLLKNDQFSDRSTSFDPQTAFSGTPAKFLRGNDLPILRLLLSGRGLYGLGGNHTHTLSGETGADIIERVLATGRCRWRSLGGPVMMRGEPRHGTIGWALTEAGTQTCIVSVADGGTAVCLVPPWYLDAEAARGGPLHLDVPPRVAATLMQAPAIEPQQVTALRDKLAERLPGETTLFPTEPQPPETNAARVLRRLDARQRFCLTGTPVENHLGELWALMDFLNPGLLGDRRSFARSFRSPIEKHGDTTRGQALARRVRPFVLRRTKAEVAGDLPPKTEIIEHVQMEAAQSAIYEAVRLTMHRKVREAVAARGLERSHIIILDALLKLRQVCCDPRLVKLPTVKKSGAGSAKLIRLMEMLDELVAEGRRVLLFSQFTSMLALIEERLAAVEIAFVKITGEVQDRATPVKRFQAGDVPVFLISLKAGGTGLNLTAADTVILYDPWWNPAVEAQAIDRSHRIGQDKPVFVHRLITQNTIEEKMLELQHRKGALAEGLFDPDASGPLNITADDIELLLAAP